MLDQAATEDNTTALRGADSQVVKLFDILGDINNKTIALVDKVID